jgi:hypothetical protein
MLPFSREPPVAENGVCLLEDGLGLLTGAPQPVQKHERVETGPRRLSKWPRPQPRVTAKTQTADPKAGGLKRIKLKRNTRTEAGISARTLTAT